jgi:DNA-binding response OmpR family regulator
MKILLIDGDKKTVKVIKEMLKVYYIVDEAYTGKTGEELIFNNDYDAIVLDVILPDIDGFQVCRDIRENNIKTPILILSGIIEVKDKINALNLGADDYLTKPFSFEELHARLQALMRRSPNNFLSDKLSLNGLILDINSNTVEYKGNKIELRLKEFRLLEYLMRNSGKVLTRSMILEHVWENDTNQLTNTVDVHINYLRNKIDRQFGVKMIKSVHGLGYKIAN